MALMFLRNFKRQYINIVHRMDIFLRKITLNSIIIYLLKNSLDFCTFPLVKLKIFTNNLSLAAKK